MTKAKLEVSQMRNAFYLVWCEDDDTGGFLGQSKTDGKGAPPEGREDWEHWAASRAVTPLAQGQDLDGFFWATERGAIAARAVANTAIRQDRELPEWARTALAAGWKPPRGWKA